MVSEGISGCLKKKKKIEQEPANELIPVCSFILFLFALSCYKIVNTKSKIEYMLKMKQQGSP